MKKTIIPILLTTVFASCSPVHLTYDNNLNKLFKDTAVAAPESYQPGHSVGRDLEAARHLFRQLRLEANLPEAPEEVSLAARALVREYINPNAPEGGQRNSTFDLLEARLNLTGHSLKDVAFVKTALVGLFLGIPRN